MPAPSQMLRPWCLLLLLIADSRQLSISEFDVPNAIERGSNATLQCRFSGAVSVDYVKWWKTPLNVPDEDRNRQLIYQRFTKQATPEVTKKTIISEENDTILLTNLEYIDSGVYECEVSSGDVEVRQHGNLTVFSDGEGLQLNISKVKDGPDEDEDEDFLVQCFAVKVSPQPELFISVNGEEISNISQDVTEAAAGVFDVYVNATLSDDDIDDETEIRCEMFYLDRNVTHPPFMKTTFYKGAGQWQTEMPEDTTQSEVASELQNTGGATALHAGFWLLQAAAVVHLYVFY